MRAKNPLMLMIFTLVIFAGVIGIKTSNPDAQYIVVPLFEISNPFEYLTKLSSLETIDFQPVRDLSLFIDIIIFRISGIVTFSTFNAVLVGILGCLLIGFLSRTSSEKQKSMSFYWALLFVSHPILSQSVGWGMARKHLLASVLILWATNLFLDWKEGKKSWMPFLLVYVLSVLSHPVTLLWPLWAFVHLRVTKYQMTKETKKIFGFLFTTTALLFLINYTYYKIGNSIHKDVYPSINAESDIRQILYNFSFDLSQIFYPFRMAFVYYPDFTSSWPGIVFSLLIAGLLFLRKSRSSLSWIAFFLFTLPMSLTLPGVYDQYLILPLMGVVIILFHEMNFSSSKVKIMLVITAFLLGGYSHFQARIWSDEVKLNARNFEHSRNCQTAMNFAMAGYGKGAKAPAELLDFIKTNSCFELALQFPPATRRIFIFIESLMLFYEDEAIPYQKRIDRLKFLGDRHYFPRLIYAALLATENKPEEVEENTRFVLGMMKGPVPVGGTVIENVLRPYCEINKLPACLEVTNIQPQPAYL